MNMQNPLDYARHAALLSDQIDRSELAVILREFERVQDIAPGGVVLDEAIVTHQLTATVNALVAQ